MKKNKLRSALWYFWGFAAVVSAVVAAPGCAKQEIKNVDSPGKTIVCFGDSLTHGYGVEPGEDYPSVLAKMVSPPLINAGVNSNTTPEALQRMDTDVLAHNPKLVIIEFGCNDFLKQIPADVTSQNIGSMIDRIQRKGAMVAIVDVSAGILFKEYQSLLRDIARAKRAIFIPNVLYNVTTNPSLKSDFVHPNAQGYALIAQRILKVIQPYLEQNERFRQSAKVPQAAR